MNQQNDSVGVSVSIRDYGVDMTLPLHAPVGSFLHDLVEECESELVRQGRSADFFEGPPASWHIERFGNRSIPGGESLASAGVHEGDQIYLRKGDPTEIYPALIDDVAEFVEHQQNIQFPPWGPKYSRPLSAMLLLVCAGAGLAATVLFAAARPGLPPLVRYGIVAALVVGAALGFAITLICDRAEDTAVEAVPKWGFWLGYALAAAAAAILVPRPLSLYTVLIVAVVFATLAVILYAATKRHPMAHVSTAVAAVLAAGAPALSRLYPWPTMTLAAQTMAVALFMLKYSPQVSQFLAKVNLPYIPATGETYIRNLKGDVSTLPLITSKDETLDSIFHQEQRVAALRHTLLAVTSGAAATMIASAFLMGWALNGPYWTAMFFVALVAANMVFRGQACTDAALQGVLVAAASATVLAFLAGAVASHGMSPDAATSLACLTGVAVLSVIVSIRQVSPASNNAKRLIDIIEQITHFLPYVILGYGFMGLFALFRAW